MKHFIENLSTHNTSCNCTFCQTTPTRLNAPDYSSLSATFFSIHTDTANGNFHGLLFKLLDVISNAWIPGNPSSLNIPERTLLTFHFLHFETTGYFDLPGELQKKNLPIENKDGILPVILISLRTLINTTPCKIARSFREDLLLQAIEKMLNTIASERNVPGLLEISYNLSRKPSV